LGSSVSFYCTSLFPAAGETIWERRLLHAAIISKTIGFQAHSAFLISL
jgi:hypothetical protein